MSKRKERQGRARQDYAVNRAPHARWLNAHESRCPECSTGKHCRLVVTAALRGMLGAAGRRIGA